MQIKKTNAIKVFIALIITVSTMLSMCALASEGNGKNISIRVEGISETILEEQTVIVEADVEKTALYILKEILGSIGIDYTLSNYGETEYVQSINGEEEATFGGWDGWIFLVNSETVMVGAGEYVVGDRDEIVFYYGSFPPDTLIPQIEIYPSRPKVGNDIIITVKSSYYDYSKDEVIDVLVQDAVISFDSSNYLTDENGQVVIENITSQGEYIFNVSKDIEGSFPQLLRTGNISVFVEIDYYTILDMYFTDLSGNSIISFNSEELVVANVEATKNLENHAPGLLMIVLYNENGALKDIKFMRINLEQGQSTTFGAGVRLEEGDKIKAFVWENFMGMRHLSYSLIYPMTTAANTPTSASER